MPATHAECRMQNARRSGQWLVISGQSFSVRQSWSRMIRAAENLSPRRQGAKLSNSGVCFASLRLCEQIVSLENPKSKIRCSPASRPPSRAAFTLIEMLVTVTIMLILVTATVTMFRPANEERRIREAARAINVYLGSARNRAMETGRPCGVMFRMLRDGGGNPIVRASMNADQCEEPAAYSGDSEYGRAQIIETSRDSQYAVLEAYFDPAGTFNSDLIQVGNMVQFNAQGPLYEVIFLSPANDYFRVRLDISHGQLHPWMQALAWDSSTTYTAGKTVLNNGRLYVALDKKDGDGNTIPNVGNPPSSSPDFWAAAPMPLPVLYRVFRSPAKGFAQPLQLPAAAVVDMTASGIGDNAAFNVDGDTVVMFDPNGAVEYVSIGGTAVNPTEPIYLLVGKRERVGNGFVQNNANEQTLTNYQDLNNLWVVINPHTGLITTDNVASSAGQTTEAAAIAASRTLADKAQGIGGR